MPFPSFRVAMSWYFNRNYGCNTHWRGLKCCPFFLAAFTNYVKVWMKNIMWKSENLKLKAKIERIENLRKWNCKLKSPALLIFTVGHHDQNSAKHQTHRITFHTGLYDRAWKIEIRPWIKSLYMKNTEQTLRMKNTRHQNRTYKSQF